MPADEHEYQQQLDELRDAASRAMGHTHEVIDSLEEHTPAQASRTPNKPTGSWMSAFLPRTSQAWDSVMHARNDFFCEFLFFYTT